MLPKSNLNVYTSRIRQRPQRAAGLDLQEEQARTALPPAAIDAARQRVARLPPVQPRTMVDQAAEAIVAAAVRGAFLPGDRLVEAEIARDLGISRVPVREALRLLESQGIVVSTPYKGMRLMRLTNAGAAERMRVRLALELLAVREALRLPGGAERFAGLRAAAEAHARAAGGDDLVDRVNTELRFHAELCRTAANATLLALWQGLARQLSVIWGIAEPERDAGQLNGEHLRLLAALEAGDGETAATTLTAHIGWHQDFDFEHAVERRRRHRHT